MKSAGAYVMYICLKPISSHASVARIICPCLLCWVVTLKKQSVYQLSDEQMCGQYSVVVKCSLLRHIHVTSYVFVTLCL